MVMFIVKAVRRVALVLTCLVLAIGSCAAQTPDWVQLGPYGGEIFGLAVAPGPSPAWYAVVGGAIGEPNGVYRSTDDGKSWRGLTLAAGCDAHSVAVSPDDAGTVYVGCRGKVLRSVDGGEKWAILPFGEGETAWLLESFPGVPGALAVVGDGLYVTRDGGDTWDHVRFDNIDHIAVAGSGESARLLAGISAGLLASDDLGESWVRGAPGLPEDETDRWVESLAVGGAARERVYAATDGGIFTSEDAGRTWSKAGDPPLGGAGYPVSVSALAVDPDDERTVYLAALNSVFVSRDGCAGWAPAGTELPPWTSLRWVAAAPDPEATILAAGDGVFRLTAGSRRWELAADGIPHETVGKIRVEPGEPWRLIAAANYEGLEVSGDGGAHWLFPKGDTGRPEGTIGWDPTIHQMAYAVGAESWLSRDGGASWSRIGDGPRDSGFVDLDVAPTTPRTLWVASGPPYGGVWRSRDGGITWERVYLEFSHGGAYAVAVAPSDPNTVYASLFDEGVIRSFDGGDSWAVPPSPPAEPFVDLVVHRTDPEISWGVSRDGSVVRTTDGWRTAEVQTRGLEGVHVVRLSPDREHSRHLVAIARSGGYESWNAGASWLRLGNPGVGDVFTGAWEPLSRTLLLAPWAHSLVATTLGTEPLSVEVEAEPDSGGGGVRLTARIHGGSVPYDILWDVGDGTGEVAGNPVVHAFQKLGTYPVRVTVTDHLSNVAEAEREIMVPVVRGGPARRVRGRR